MQCNIVEYISYNMGNRDLPDIYTLALGPAALGLGYGTARFKLDTRDCSTRVFLLLIPSFFVKSRVFITNAREIAVHNTLRATCKSHHTSMQDTCVISKIMARRKSNLKMGRIFMQTHLPLCSD